MKGHDETASRQLTADDRTQQTEATLTIVSPRKLHTRLVLEKAVLEIGRAVKSGLSIDMVSVSRVHAAITPSRGSHILEDRQSRHGTFVNRVRLTEPHRLVDQDVVRFGDVLAVYESPSSASPVWPELPGLAHRVAEARRTIGRAAHDPAPVLILGETGTGKESAAALVHRLSARKGPFVAVNCAALPAQLVESQLFGHVKGAFTGAESNHLGFFRAAEKGTLFLDELGEVALETQAKLLRALQEREVTPVGTATPTKTDVRVVAATNRSLSEDVERGTFRRDLYARLALWTVTLPALRERRVDIVDWLARFLGRWRHRPIGEVELPLTPEALEQLLLAPLKENLRGLDQLAHRIRDENGLLPVSALPAQLLSREREGAVSPQPAAQPAGPIRRPTREELEELIRSHGSIRAVAKHFGRERKQIYRWIEQLGVQWSGTTDDE